MAEFRGRMHPAPDVVSRRLGNQAILIDLETARMFALNDSATAVWECVRGGGALIEEVAACLERPERVPADQMTAGIATCLRELQRLGLLAGSADESDRSDMSPAPYPVPRPRLSDWSAPTVQPIGTLAEALPPGGLPMPGLRRSD